MKVFISMDMEGVAGIVDWNQVSPKHSEYAIGRELMTGEAAAAVEGALEAGAREIVVGDSHASMFNLLAEKMPTQARLVQGRCKPLSMMQGIDRSFDACAFVGYHAMRGTAGGVLSHTYSGVIYEAWLNRVLVGEPGMNATLAASFGVPLMFLSGDEAVCREVRGLLPGIETVAVKKGFGIKAASSIHPQKAREAIRAGIRKALSGKGKAKGKGPRRGKLPKSPFTLRLVLVKPEMADLCEAIPGIQRKEARVVEFRHRDFRTVYGAFLTVMRISGIAIQD